MQGEKGKGGGQELISEQRTGRLTNGKLVIKPKHALTNTAFMLDLVAELFGKHDRELRRRCMPQSPQSETG
jgi:hypothetical protein